MIRQVKHMGQADSTSIGPTSGADARQGAAGEFGSVECNDVESGRATDTDTTPREAAATPIRVAVVDDHEMFRAGEVKKTYWAVVKNAPKESEGELVHFLVRNEKQNKSYAYDKEVPNSKKAVLDYRLIGRSDNYYLLEVDLKTGRHHQIRCQLAKMGCPIKGDLKYGSPRSNPDGSICLHARRVRFVHPVSKELIELKAPLPEGNLWKGFELF